MILIMTMIMIPNINNDYYYNSTIGIDKDGKDNNDDDDCAA